jgi:hypothetical protein
MQLAPVALGTIWGIIITAILDFLSTGEEHFVDNHLVIIR